jgi:hypothetical protein
LAIASAVGDWTGWSGCVMRKKLEWHIAFRSFSETIPAGTFIHLRVLNFDVQKEKNFKNVRELMIISINCSQFFN